MMRLIEHMLGITRVTVTERERLLVLVNGRITGLYGPGEHRLPRRNLALHRYDLDDLRCTSPLVDTLWRDHPDIAARHLTRLAAGPDEMVVLYRDGRPHEVLRPDTRVDLWTDAGPWTAEPVPVRDTLRIDPALADRLERIGTRAQMLRYEVPEAHVGLLTVDGAVAATLDPGVHRYWNAAGRKLALKLVDTRWRTHDVTGQDILTRDRVTLRVNIAAAYRVTDPARAVTAVNDYAEALHRALQLAFRKTLGALTLDRLLAEKVTVDAEAATAVRAEMAEIGLEVGEIALKDVILPGEMREILNQVVAAEKEAEANVIRRREETNATRSLLNTAKVMAENPVMLRLKELEALEAIAGKVERLTVHNGTEGLLTDLVRLRD